MNNLNISFIGGGNMARSLIGGLIADGRNPATIWVSDTNDEQLLNLQQQFQVHTSRSNSEAIDSADILILAVKPQVMHTVTTELREVVQRNKPLVISIAAGIRIEDIDRWLGGNIAIVRAMPNTPALIQTGATALHANPLVSPEQRNSAETILRAVGLALWVNDEKMMDAVTALSGSGPAYFFLFIEAMEEAARALGLPEQTARLLTLQTAFGATKMALESSEDCATLRRRVTSPGGTTEQAIRAFEEGELRQLVAKALTAAALRSKELAQQLGAKQ
jgi:pyrroline-5-carboxylate reductase